LRIELKVHKLYLSEWATAFYTYAYKASPLFVVLIVVVVFFFFLLRGISGELLFVIDRLKSFDFFPESGLIIACTEARL